MESKIESLNLNKFKTLNQIKSKDNTELLIPTRRPLEILMTLGWIPVDVQEVNSKKYKGYQPHTVRLRNEHYSRLIEDGCPELILKTAHIPKSSFRFMLGFHKYSSGENFIVNTDEIEKETVRHYGYGDDKLREAVYKITSKIGLVLLQIQNFKQKKLSFAEEEKYMTMVSEALDIKPVRLFELSLSTKLEDSVQGKRNLWQSMTVLHNNIINGKYYILSVNDKIRKAKVNIGMNQVELISKTIWNISNEFIKTNNIH